jgi:hypothetical protein
MNSSILQMVNTRNHNDNDNHKKMLPTRRPTDLGASPDNASSNVADNATNNGQGHQQTPQPQHRDKMGEFQRTKPLTFSHSTKPMDVDD